MPPKSKWPGRVASISGAASILLGFVVMLGWAIHSVPLIQILPHLAPMQRTTALSFMLCGIALLLINAGWQRVAATSAALAWVISALTSLEYIFDADFGIDELLGSWNITVQAPQPGRMSPVTAVCLFLISSALLVFALPRLGRLTSAIAGIVGSIVVTVVAVGEFSDLIGHREAFVWGHLARVAIHTWIGFALLGAGLLALAWKDEYPRKNLPEWLPWSAGIPAAISVVGLWQAFVAHDESRFTFLSYSLLVGGLVFSVLFGFTVHLAQKAWNRSTQLLVYRMAFESSSDGLLITSPDGSIHAANPSACSMLQRTEEEICREGRNGIANLTDPRLKAFMERRARTGSARGEVTFKYKNGTPFPVEASSVIFKGPGGDLRTTMAFRDIKERKKWEQRLKEQAALIDLAHDAILVRDQHSRIVFWNQGATLEYGWPAKEAIGKITHHLLQTVFPIPLPEIERVVLESGHWEGELLHTTRDGKQIIVASRWSLQSDGEGHPHAFLEINRNITLRKRAEAELKLLNERLSLATQVASLGVWDLDLRTRSTVWDDTLFEMYGIHRKIPMPYEDWARLVHPEDLPGAEASLKRVVDLKTQDYVEFRIIRPDGALRYCSFAQGVVLDEQGVPIRIVGVGMDITERKRTEAQLEASARLSALGVMAGGVAHEVNSPLMIVHAAASDLLSTAREEGKVSIDEVIKKATIIRQTADRIAKIVQSLRRIAREGSQDRFSPVKAAKVVEDALEICQARFKANSVKLLLPENDLNIMVSCREVQIAQILLNLLTNGFDAVVDLEGEKWVRLEVEKRGETVAFSVMDSGPGVPEKLKSRIMEPFFTTKDVGKGTGLGLSLSRTVAEEHGGKLELMEESAHTCFVLTLPLVRKKESLWN